MGDGNFKHYPRKPKIADNAILALALCTEALSIDSENYFWSKLKTDHFADFNSLIDRSSYNRRKKNISPYMAQYNQRIANELNDFEDIYIVDSMPLSICNIARAGRLRICKEHFESSPIKATRP